jgi:enoyl-CoA hydratase
MEHLTVTRDGDVLVATMARGKANALNSAMVEELHQVTAQARDEAAVRAFVLASASTRLFSGGFDLGEVFGYDDARMRAFFDRFVSLLDTLRTLPKGTVAAVSGHAYAGGALLALACDFRVMAEGDAGFAINEVNLGLVLPVEGTRWMAPLLAGTTRELLLGGVPLTSQRAREIGLASALAPAEGVRDRAVALARALAEKPPLAFAAIKRGILEATGSLEDVRDRGAFVDDFMKYWSGEESRARRRAVLESMKR